MANDTIVDCVCSICSICMYLFVPHLHVNIAADFSSPHIIFSRPHSLYLDFFATHHLEPQHEGINLCAQCCLSYFILFNRNIDCTQYLHLDTFAILRKFRLDYAHFVQFPNMQTNMQKCFIECLFFKIFDKYCSFPFD